MALPGKETWLDCRVNRFRPIIIQILDLRPHNEAGSLPAPAHPAVMSR